MGPMEGERGYGRSRSSTRRQVPVGDGALAVGPVAADGSASAPSASTPTGRREHGERGIEDHAESPARRSSTSSSADWRDSRSPASRRRRPGGPSSWSADPDLDAGRWRWRTAPRCSRSAAGAGAPTARCPGSRSTSPRRRWREGDWAGAAEVLELESGEHRDTAIVNFRLACCHARLGETARALEELRRASRSSRGCASAPTRRRRSRPSGTTRPGLAEGERRGRDSNPRESLRPLLA